VQVRTRPDGDVNFIEIVPSKDKSLEILKESGRLHFVNNPEYTVFAGSGLALTAEKAWDSINLPLAA
jgi:hypothetical protein